MTRPILAAALALALASPAAADMIRVQSPHSVPETIDRLAAAVEGAGATVFARVDHQKGAESIGAELPAATVLFFGNPKLGTPLMADGITAGLDLPLRALAYQDGDTVWLIYHDPADIAAAHGLPADHPVVARMTGALGKLTGKAVAE